MDANELKQKHEELANSVKESLLQLEKKAEAAAKGEVAKLESGDIAKLKAQVAEFTESFTKNSEDKKKAQDQLDAVEIQLKKLKDNGHSNAAGETIRSQMQKAFEENEAFAKYQHNKSGMGEAIKLKAVGDIIPGTQVGAGVAPEVRRPGFIGTVRRDVRVRDLLSIGSTSSDNFKFVQQSGGEGTVTTVAAGATKPQIDKDIALVNAPVTKIAAHMRVAEELINDVPGLASFLSFQGVEDLYDVEDTQLLFGNGVGANLTGITDGASVTATSNPLIDLVDNAQTIDAIIASLAKLAASEYMGTGILMNPADYYAMMALKDTQNNYLQSRLVFEGGMAYVDGVPIIKTTAMTAGQLLTGNWQRGAQLIQREGVSVRFYDQDQDNAVKNLVTIVMEERLALPIYYPTMFTYDAIADITAAIETP